MVKRWTSVSAHLRTCVTIWLMPFLLLIGFDLWYACCKSHSTRDLDRLTNICFSSWIGYQNEIKMSVNCRYSTNWAKLAIFELFTNLFGALKCFRKFTVSPSVIWVSAIIRPYSDSSIDNEFRTYPKDTIRCLWNHWNHSRVLSPKNTHQFIQKLIRKTLGCYGPPTRASKCMIFFPHFINLMS